MYVAAGHFGDKHNNCINITGYIIWAHLRTGKPRRLREGLVMSLGNSGRKSSRHDGYSARGFVSQGCMRNISWSRIYLRAQSKVYTWKQWES